MTRKDSHFPYFMNDTTAKNQLCGVLDQTKLLQNSDSMYSHVLWLKAHATQSDVA
jgi:hypothetical protein